MIGKVCFFCEVGIGAEVKLNILGLTIKLDTRVYNTRCLSFFDVHIVIDLGLLLGNAARLAYCVCYVSRGMANGDEIIIREL